MYKLGFAVIFVLAGCGGIRINFNYAPQYSYIPFNNFALNFQGVQIERDSSRVYLRVLGTEPDFSYFFGVSPSDFFNAAILREFRGLSNVKIRDNAMLSMKVIINDFYLDYDVEDVGESAEGLRYMYNIKGKIVFKVFLINRKNGRSKSFLIKRNYSGIGFLYTWGNWDSALKTELIRFISPAFSQMLEELDSSAGGLF